MKFDVSNTSCYVEVENGALLCDVARSWKMIIGGHGKFLGKKCGNSDCHVYGVRTQSVKCAFSGEVLN